MLNGSPSVAMARQVAKATDETFHVLGDKILVTYLRLRFIKDDHQPLSSLDLQSNTT